MTVPTSSFLSFAAAATATTAAIAANAVQHLIVCKRKVELNNARIKQVITASTNQFNNYNYIYPA